MYSEFVANVESPTVPPLPPLPSPPPALDAVMAFSNVLHWTFAFAADTMGSDADFADDGSAVDAVVVAVVVVVVAKMGKTPEPMPLKTVCEPWTNASSSRRFPPTGWPRSKQILPLNLLYA